MILLKSLPDWEGFFYALIFNGAAQLSLQVQSIFNTVDTGLGNRVKPLKTFVQAK